jgi:hypothetical protein
VQRCVGFDCQRRQMRVGGKISALALGAQEAER